MSNYQISYADLSAINNALSSIGSQISNVNSELNSINYKQDQFENDLQTLANAFNIFVEADTKHKQLQLAETRVGNYRQELQIKFGYYAEIRRMAVGILQGVDTGIVSDDTLKFSTEEVMIKAPGYWLAPALVAVSSWIRNDKATADRALNESLKRDDYKTTLFLMLLMRRLARNEASLKWLERYFLHQNLHNLDREFIVVLEAVTTGVFAPAARALMMQNVKRWVQQLTQADNFVDAQKAQWIKFFEASKPQPENNYPLLKQFAKNWHALELSLLEARAHDILQGHFNRIISTGYDFSIATKVQLDEILSLLVTNFDDEELPLQKKVRLNQLIIEKDGDRAAAEAIMEAENHIFDEKVDFLQMITNAAFNPELAGATKVTQTLAVSISQPWILEAHDTFTAQSRSRVPQYADMSIDEWASETSDGSDELQQISKQETYYQGVLEAELSKVSFPMGGVIIGALIALGGLWGFSIYFIIGLIGLGIGGVMVWININNYNRAKANIKNNVEERKKKAKEVLRGCIAEVVDYRKELATEDAKAEKLQQLLKSITPEDFSSISKDTVRNII